MKSLGYKPIFLVADANVLIDYAKSGRVVRNLLLGQLDAGDDAALVLLPRLLQRVEPAGQEDEEADHRRPDDGETDAGIKERPDSVEDRVTVHVHCLSGPQGPL